MSDYGYTPHIGEPSFPTQNGSERTQTEENDTHTHTQGDRDNDGNGEKTDLQKAYEVFGLEEGAEILAVIKKYKKLSLIYHPDSRSSSASGLTSEEKTAKFQEISWAYQTIGTNFLSEAQKGKEKDEIITELRKDLTQTGISNYYYIAALEKLSKEFEEFQSQLIWGWIERIIVLTLACLFFYFRRNKEEKENSKKMLMLIRYVIAYAIYPWLALIVLIWDIVAYFVRKKDPKKEINIKH